MASSFFSAPSLWSMITSDQVKDRISQLNLPFNRYGYDRFGISQEHLGAFYTLLDPFYRSYFKVVVSGIEHIPREGRGMLIGNHSGGIPVDAGMLMASLFFDQDPPRHAHGMVEKFAQNLPFLSPLFSRLGQFSGLPEHARQILSQDRLLLVFPEGARGTGKMYKDRYQLERFGTGFVRIALQTKSPIIPFAFIGGEEAMPIVYHADLLAKIAGVPYWPVPKHILPIPKPVLCNIEYGSPLVLDGDGNEPDEVILAYVDQVKSAIVDLIESGLRKRQNRLKFIERESQE